MGNQSGNARKPTSTVSFFGSNVHHRTLTVKQSSVLQHADFTQQLKIQIEVFRNANPTLVSEKPDVVFFKTPPMRAKATVTAPPVPKGQIWTIGWVQSVYQMNFVNVYKTMGFSSWEFPQLNQGLPGVNDSDGLSYPFYGQDTEVFQLAGPIARSTTFCVTMSDMPASQISMKVPSRHFGSGASANGIDLSCIRRKQKFNSWLVAYNELTGECFELKCLYWDVDIHIDIDGGKRSGERVMLKEPKQQMCPQLNPDLPIIPMVALTPPDANHAQMLVWRPHDSNMSGKLSTISIIVAPQTRGKLLLSKAELTNEKAYELAKMCLQPSSSKVSTDTRPSARPEEKNV